VPTPTADEIAAAVAEDVADGVASATTDGQSATAMDPEKRLDIADRLQARAITGSGWGATRSARAIFRGTHPE
jgi:hypothetical protein